MEIFAQLPEDASDRSANNPRQQSEQPTIPEPIQQLIAKERIAEKGQGPELSQLEYAELSSWRQFPKDEYSKYRALAKKEILSSTDGLALTPEEQKDLEQAREKWQREALKSEDHKIRTQAILQYLSKRAEKTDNPVLPESIAQLRDKLKQAISGIGPKPTNTELAELTSWSEFPFNKDSQYRKLAQKEILSRFDGPKLTTEEFADLNSKRHFPKEEDSKYRALSKKEILVESGGSDLTPEEHADLISKRQFPHKEDSHYRDLAKKEILSSSGGHDLTPDEKADLFSKRQFPDKKDSHYKELAKKEILSGFGGPKLTPEEIADLHSKKQFPEEKYLKYRELAKKEALSLFGGPKLTDAELKKLADATNKRLQENLTSPDPKVRANAMNEYMMKQSLKDPINTMPEAIKKLADKEIQSSLGKGPDLTNMEKADLFSWRQFPNNLHYQNLVKKEILSSSGGPELTLDEKADLYSKRQFPDDEKHRNLVKKEILGEGGGPKLTPQEKEELFKAREERDKARKEKDNE